jgi:uncharacterized membrane protein YczE
VGRRPSRPGGDLIAGAPAHTKTSRPEYSAADWVNRLTRCVGGLALFGIGIALILEAHLGAAPWDVFHQGVSHLTGISVGNVIIITGLVLLLVWIPLRQRPGVGTLLNAIEIGLFVDLVEPLVPSPAALGWRMASLAGGIVVIAIGSGLYIGAGLGAGPRDGIMMGLRARGISVRVARTAIEVVVLIAGVLLGGSIGVGTIAFTVCIGPLVQIFLPRLSLPARSATVA